MRKQISRKIFACLVVFGLLPGVSFDAMAADTAAMPASSASAPSGASETAVFPAAEHNGASPATAATPASAASAVRPDAAASTAHATGVITPDDARRAVGVLQDPQQRAQALSTLQAIVAVAPVSGAVVLPAAAPAVAPPAAPLSASQAPAAPASAPTVLAAAASSASAVATAPIEANGLIAQLLRQVGHWADGLSDQVTKLLHAIAALPSFGTWLIHTFGTPYGKQLAIKALTTLAAVFAASCALEWGLRRILRRPRKALVEHAELVDKRAAEQAARDAQALRKRLQLEAQQEAQRKKAAELAAAAEQRAQEAQIAKAKDARSTTSLKSAEAGSSAAATAKSDDAAEQDAIAAAQADAAQSGGDIALVRTQVDGKERIEAVRVDAGDGVSGGAAMDASAAAAQSDEPNAVPASVPERSAQHWSTLRHLPYAMGALVLDLLPLLLFFVTAGLVLRWLAGDNGSSVQDMTEGFVNAYLTIRVTMTVIRLLVSPVGHGLQVLQVNADTSQTVEIWVRRIMVLGAFGVAITNGANAFGASHAAQIAFMKLVSLLVHISVVILIFHTRKSVSTLISANASTSAPLAAVRNWLAEVWAFFASFVVMAVWVVWALGVEDGFPKLIHFIGVTAGVIVVARLLAILVLGALGRLFHRDEADADEIKVGRRLAERYFPIVRSVVSFVIIVCTIVALMEVWGFNAIAWFTRGPLGRNLTSAAMTIGIAAVVAIAVWESANLGVERRLARWNEHGDVVRAARLRTLLPMLRTCLFISIVLIVGLTALNEIGINTTPLLAGASIIGVALGFGSQKLVQDFITGIFLLMENAMQVGDWVTVAGVSGSVEYLSIRTVRLRASDGSLHIVPFSSVSTVNNTNRGIGNAAVKVSVAYDSDIDLVLSELKQIGASIRNDPDFKDLTLNDLELWGVDSLDGSMVTLTGQIRCLDKGRWGVQRAFNRRMFERFRELGIEIANPHTSHLLLSEEGGGHAREKIEEAAAPSARAAQGGKEANESDS